MEIFEQELSNRQPLNIEISSLFRSPHVDPGRVVMADGDTAEVELEEIRYGNRVFSGRSAHALHRHPINKDLIAHFKSKGDSVSWGIAESIEKYEEDTKKKVSWGTDIASLYDQETERELAKEVENRINKALIDMDPWTVLVDDDDDDDEEQAIAMMSQGADENKSKPKIDVQKALKQSISAFFELAQRN